jgi:hypothetical protein
MDHLRDLTGNKTFGLSLVHELIDFLRQLSAFIAGLRFAKKGLKPAQQTLVRIFFQMNAPSLQPKNVRAKKFRAPKFILCPSVFPVKESQRKVYGARKTIRATQRLLAVSLVPYALDPEVIKYCLTLHDDLLI